MKVQDIIKENAPTVGDRFHFELDNVLIETGIIGFTEDGVILEADSKALALLKVYGATFESINVSLKEGMSDVDIIFRELAEGIRDIYTTMIDPQSAEEQYVADKLQDMFYDVIEDFSLNPREDLEQIIVAMGDRLYDEYSEKDDTDFVINEAEYQGRKVPLGKPMKGDVKKSKVYVKGPKGNVVKVNFGDKNMKIKKSNPKRRKSFRARHNCDNPGPRWKARYWSCRAW